MPAQRTVWPQRQDRLGSIASMIQRRDEANEEVACDLVVTGGDGPRLRAD
jgi:hypothetical protein